MFDFHNVTLEAVSVSRL